MGTTQLLRGYFLRKPLVDPWVYAIEERATGGCTIVGTVYFATLSDVIPVLSFNQFLRDRVFLLLVWEFICQKFVGSDPIAHLYVRSGVEQSGGVSLVGEAQLDG